MWDLRCIVGVLFPLRLLQMSTSCRYSSRLENALDKTAYILMYPWLTVLSLTISCYLCVTPAEHRACKRIRNYFLYGPLGVLALILLLPSGLCGMVLWVVLCTVGRQNKLVYAKFEQLTKSGGVEAGLPSVISQQAFTFATANVLLAPEFLSRINNNGCVHFRLLEIAKRLLKQGKCPLENMVELKKGGKKEDSVCAEFPPMDFICFQEVWERYFSCVLMKQLCQEYPYFIYDVGEYGLRTNRCILGSGLMLASKFPILEADFHTFTYRTSFAQYICNGVLCVKVLLGNASEAQQQVGYLANVHTQAYQGQDPVVYSQLSEMHDFVKGFCQRTTHDSDIVLFNVIAGDFNFDNMSPSDKTMQSHPLFNQYEDACYQEIGCDQSWAIGSELRQHTLYHESLDTPENFRKVLIDDELRRLFVVDADLEVQTLALASSKPKTDTEGKINAEPWGGMRRIDRIVWSKEIPTEVLGYSFVTALNGLTDHIPVCMRIRPGAKACETPDVIKRLDPEPQSTDF